MSNGTADKTYESFIITMQDGTIRKAAYAGEPVTIAQVRQNYPDAKSIKANAGGGKWDEEPPR